MIYRLSTDQIVATKEYRTVPIPEDIGDTLYKLDTCENKPQIKDVDKIISTTYNDQSTNYNNNSDASINDENQHLKETNEFLPSFLLTSLRSKFPLSSLLASLQYGILLLSLLASLQYGFL